jgi:hypothetical protein
MVELEMEWPPLAFMQLLGVTGTAKLTNPHGIWWELARFFGVKVTNRKHIA